MTPLSVISKVSQFVASGAHINQAKPLRDWNELIGRDEPQVRIDPADQGPGAAEPTGLKVHDGLVMHLELPLLDGPVEVLFDFPQEVAGLHLFFRVAFQEGALLRGVLRSGFGVADGVVRGHSARPGEGAHVIGHPHGFMPPGP